MKSPAVLIAGTTHTATSAHMVARMARRPVMLDLCCGAGGAAMGYYRAGWDVIGVDKNPQPHFPFTFRQGDMFKALPRLVRGNRVAAVHVSPPCQRYSYMALCRPDLAARYPDYIPVLREWLEHIGLPYVIENVPPAPLRKPILLCGYMFRHQLVRHRCFESNVKLVAPQHRKHRRPVSAAGHYKPRTVMSVAGHIAPIAKARAIMDINWMTRDELVEAIPPYYTEYVGRQLIKAVR